MTLIINDIPEESPDYELQSTGVIERTNALIAVACFSNTNQNGNGHYQIPNHECLIGCSQGILSMTPLWGISFLNGGC